MALRRVQCAYLLVETAVMTLCEMCHDAVGTIRLKGKLGMMVCPACKTEVDDRLTAERGMAAERARLLQAGIKPDAGKTWISHPIPRKRGRPRKQDVPDLEQEMTEGDAE